MWAITSTIQGTSMIVRTRVSNESYDDLTNLCWSFQMDAIEDEWSIPLRIDNYHVKEWDVQSDPVNITKQYYIRF